MRTHRHVVAAAPAALGELLAGPARTVPLLHRGVHAVYLDLRGSAGLPGPKDPAVLGVLSASATALPCGLQTMLPRLSPDMLGATEAVLGRGGMLLGNAEVVITRIVDVTVPRLPEAAVEPGARLLDDLVGRRLAPIRAELAVGALADLAAGSPASVPALVGSGSGLTPVGDDVLCGWLALNRAVGADHDPTPVAEAVLRRAPGGTTALSATLLGCAARGEVLPEFRRLLLSLLDPAPANVAARVDALLRVGHTSGAGLLLGATTALHHLASRSLTP